MASEKKETLSFFTTWMNVMDILSEVRHRRMISLLHEIQKKSNSQKQGVEWWLMPTHEDCRDVG